MTVPCHAGCESFSRGCSFLVSAPPSPLLGGITELNSQQGCQVNSLTINQELIHPWHASFQICGICLHFVRLLLERFMILLWVPILMSSFAASLAGLCLIHAKLSEIQEARPAR